MDRSNAEKGIKKVYIAQVFAIIASFFSSASWILTSFSIELFGNDIKLWLSPLGGANILLAFVSSVLLILTAVLSFLGYYQASKDEPEFKKSMICILLFGAFSVIGPLLKVPNGMISTIFNSAGTIFDMFVVIYATSGLINLSEKYERSDLAKKGETILRFFVVTYIISALSAIAIRISELSSHLQFVLVIAGFIGFVLSITQTIVYMKYLSQSKKMLENS